MKDTEIVIVTMNWLIFFDYSANAINIKSSKTVHFVEIL